MSDVTLLLPDFALILIGFVVCRWTPMGRSVWEGVERLVYYMLFPALLFTAIARNPLSPGDALPLAAGAVGVTALGIVLALSLGRWRGLPPVLHASGAQVAYRFNSYVALAVVERLGGAPGLASIAVIVSLVVPMCNVAAVWPLARHGKIGYGRELLRNPLILATVAGLVFNVLGLRLPDLAAITMQRMGGAALPLGLMAVGAGLRFGALREGPALAAALLSIRHALLPGAAIAYALLSGLPTLEQTVLVAFASVPTATSAYVLAARMGGRGDYVAGLVTVSTLLGMLSLPLALALLAWLR